MDGFITNPNAADTDGDGVDDSQDFDPLNPNIDGGAGGVFNQFQNTANQVLQLLTGRSVTTNLRDALRNIVRNPAQAQTSINNALAEAQQAQTAMGDLLTYYNQIVNFLNSQSLGRYSRTITRLLNNVQNFLNQANTSLGTCVTNINDALTALAGNNTTQARRDVSQALRNCSLASGRVRAADRMMQQIRTLADRAGVQVAGLTEESTEVIPLSVQGIRVAQRSPHSLALFVRGAGIKSVTLEIYDALGRKVYTEVAFGPRLEFHGLGDRGELLANGVYFYVVTVQGYNGQTVRSEVKKLAVLR